ncbi:hypothetical protein [Clostridium manihotivorum]|uniref:Uncharacterized protein n=1 Tax=Clostridium manihotivorum TaxID=2320868 RepID=A0A3R5U7M9_9CLOT|nr:hypothetical protein [Clostridium manihotivorum]QAA30958.1 hypothetical protein C1I91_04350 [Clostridium manihotivorum]
MEKNSESKKYKKTNIKKEIRINKKCKVFSQSLINKAEVYASCVGVSKEVCIVYLLSNQCIKYCHDKTSFVTNWCHLRPREMEGLDSENGVSESLNEEFSIYLSKELYEKLIRIKNELGDEVRKYLKKKEVYVIELDLLIRNMLAMELNIKPELPSGKYEDVLSKQIHPNLSAILLERIEVIAKGIGISKNELIANAIADYVGENYGYYDYNTYGDGTGNQHCGAWL